MLHRKMGTLGKGTTKVSWMSSEACRQRRLSQRNITYALHLVLPPVLYSGCSGNSMTGVEKK